MDLTERMRRLSVHWKKYARISVLVIALAFIIWKILTLSDSCQNSSSGPNVAEVQRRKAIEEDAKSRIEELEESLAKANRELRSTKLEDVEKLENAVLTITSLEQKLQELNSSSNTVTKILYEEPEKRIIGLKGHKLVHLDLKGAPPKLSYLLKVFPLFRSWGATGILIEYEDTFPYSGDLKLLQSPYAYSMKDLKTLLEEAKKNNLIVIPLIQTFGHLEFVLKQPKYSSLRESRSYFNALCPLQSGSLQLVKSLIEQVVALHPDLKWLHVGGDEVWNMKMCNLCQKYRGNRTELFLAHMVPVLNFVKSKGLTPILWDDMMRHWDIKSLKVIGDIAEPMIWGYVPHVENYFPEDMWIRYSQAFSKIWVASAFKGADKPYSIYAPVGQHVNNHESWMKVITGLPSPIQVLGVALTGWSRFDHTGPLCELLPAGLPSLALCLGVLNNGVLSEEQHKKISEGLGFKEKIILHVNNFNSLPTDQGTFPGKDVYNVINGVQQVLGRIGSAERRLNGWFGPFQIAIIGEPNFVHVKAISEAISKAFLQLKEVQSHVDGPFLDIYPKGVIDEWKYDKIDNIFKTIDKLKLDLKQKLATRKPTPQPSKKNG